MLEMLVMNLFINLINYLSLIRRYVLIPTTPITSTVIFVSLQIHKQESSDLQGGDELRSVYISGNI